MIYRPNLLVIGLLVLFASGCGGTNSSAVGGGGFRPTASLQEVMNSIIDPAADGIWESFSTTVTRKGVEEKKPESEEDWKAVRHHALALVEASNLLLIAGRPVAAPGAKLDDEGTPGINTAEDIAKAIHVDGVGFAAAVHGLHQAAVATLAAVDARDVASIMRAGAHLDQACEACHSRYWYPNLKGPSTKPFDRRVGKEAVRQ